MLLSHRRLQSPKFSKRSVNGILHLHVFFLGWGCVGFCGVWGFLFFVVLWFFFLFFFCLGCFGLFWLGFFLCGVVFWGFWLVFLCFVFVFWLFFFLLCFFFFFLLHLRSLGTTPPHYPAFANI